MATLNISLPGKMKEYVSQQVNDGAYSSDSEYVRELIRKDKIKKARNIVELKILEGLQGEGRELKSKDWEGIQKKAISRIPKST